MFVQSTDLTREKHGDINRINVCGQEKEAATYCLAKMNIALCGIRTGREHGNEAHRQTGGQAVYYSGAHQIYRQ